MLLVDATDRAALQKLHERFRSGAREQASAEVFESTQAIIAEVRARGDAALIDLSERYDGHRPASAAALRIGPEDFERALAAIGARLRGALEAAAARIRNYAERQRLPEWQLSDEHGMQMGQRVRALDRVGIYAPGGTAAYPSSVLMGAVPAKVAGVGEIVLATPAKDGVVCEEALAAAAVAGVDSAYCIGGAQAIAALAYGTETVPRVDKICGPGNAWVAEAKRQVFGVVGIDMVAGPSEIAIIADDSARAPWLAADLLAQAEHDADARAILISDSKRLLDEVARQVEEQLAQLERASIARESIHRNGVLAQVASLDDAAALVNDLAPEHLQLIAVDAEALLEQIRHAGAIFVGEYTAEVFSDYCAGPNHVLPTMRGARFSSPLGAYDFQKRSSLLRANAASVAAILEPTLCLAEAEGLSAHARAASMRAPAGDAKG